MLFFWAIPLGHWQGRGQAAPHPISLKRIRIKFKEGIVPNINI
jgi:hypothetical protein